MGLGKTIEMLALILTDLDDEHGYAPPKLDKAAAARVKAQDAAFSKTVKARFPPLLSPPTRPTPIHLLLNTYPPLLTHTRTQPSTHRYQDRKLIPSEGTLVVAPVSLVGQWESELRDKCGGRLKVHRWYGQGRQRSAEKLASLGEEDGLGLVVLTTYETLAQMHCRAPERFDSWREEVGRKEEAKLAREARKKQDAKAQRRWEEEERQRKEAKVMRDLKRHQDYTYGCYGEGVTQASLERALLQQMRAWADDQEEEEEEAPEPPRKKQKKSKHHGSKKCVRRSPYAAA